MTQKEHTIRSAEDLIRRVLSENFGQHLDNETLRSVAEKVSRSVPAMKKVVPHKEREAA